MEADWRVFRQRVPEWRERFLQAKNKELIALLSDPDATPTEQFWNTEGRIAELAKTLRDCLDGHSRSSMVSFLALMRAKGMIDASDLDEFSESCHEELRFYVR